MKSNKLFLSLFATAALASSIFAVDNNTTVPMATHMEHNKNTFEHHKPPHFGLIDKRVVKMLALSQEQNEKLISLRAEMKEQLKGSFKNRPNIGMYMKDGAFDKAAFVADSTQKASKMVEVRAEFLSKFIDILTPEQKTKLAEYKPKERGHKKQ